MGLIKLIKNYRELGHEEFMKKLKGGIEQVTPYQKSKSSLIGMWIVMLGMTCGLVANLITRIEGFWWWICIILAGSLFLQGISILGEYQKYLALKRDEDIMKSFETDFPEGEDSIKIREIMLENLDLSGKESERLDNSQGVENKGYTSPIPLPKNKETLDVGCDVDLSSPDFNDGFCKCEHHSKDHSYEPDALDGNLYCDKCECKNYNPVTSQRKNEASIEPNALPSPYQLLDESDKYLGGDSSQLNQKQEVK